MEIPQASGPDAMDIDAPSTVLAPPPIPPVTNGIAGPSNHAPTTQDSPHTTPAPAWSSVGYVYDAQMTFHCSPDGHPEQPARIERIFQLLVDKELTRRMKQLPIREVRREEALLVHSEDHWDKVIAIQYMDAQQRADSAEFYEAMSLYVMDGTTRAALLSCGGAIEASLAVAQGHVKKSFAIVRPPGHHAEPDDHMGFCFFNNVAVAARVVQQMTPLKRILILDWDVHHGNGTQRAFNDDPSVLYISLHRYEEGRYYPCGPFGGLESNGTGEGTGFSINIPWAGPEMGDADYIHAFQKVIMPIATEFAPELVMISAGFDAADGDDLGECYVSPAGYAHMTHMLSGLAGGKLVVALEGGYNLDAISESALAVTRVLLGEAPDALPPMVASEEATEVVWQAAKFHSKWWRNLDPKSCEPQEEVEPLAHSISEILKAHRQYYLATTYKMMEVPMSSQDLSERYSMQVMSTDDLFENETIVLLVHEFGNLRMELEHSTSCDVHLQKSYLLDFSKQLIEWVRADKYALLDVNLFPKPPAEAPNNTRNVKPPGEDSAKEVLLYLWDNFIQLSNAKNVIVIGHGPGCRAVSEFLTRRPTGVMNSVKLVIQIAGLQTTAHAPTGLDELRLWYKTHSVVIVPSAHSLNSKDRVKEIRKHGEVIRIDTQAQPSQLAIQALPFVRELTHRSIGRPRSATTPPPPPAAGTTETAS